MSALRSAGKSQNIGNSAGRYPCTHLCTITKSKVSIEVCRQVQSQNIGNSAERYRCTRLCKMTKTSICMYVQQTQSLAIEVQKQKHSAGRYLCTRLCTLTKNSVCNSVSIQPAETDPFPTRKRSQTPKNLKMMTSASSGGTKCRAIPLPTT